MGGLSRPARRTDAQGERGRLGLLPDAQPRSPHPLPFHRRRPGPGARGRAPPMGELRQRARPRRGQLFDGRFASLSMDEAHLMSAVRYVALNPVRAGLAARAEDWSWLSTRAHLKGEDDGRVSVGPVLARTTSFAELIGSDDAPGALAAIRRPRRPVGPWGRRPSSPTWNAGWAAPSPGAHRAANRHPNPKPSRVCSDGLKLGYGAPVPVFSKGERLCATAL